MMLDNAEILQEEDPKDQEADALWSAAEETAMSEEADGDEIITLKIEKSVMLFWGWVGFGLAILSFFYPLLPGISFTALASWMILKSSPHLADRIASQPWIKKHLPMIKGDEDLPESIKYGLTAVLATVAVVILLTAGQLALVAFGLFVCLPVIGLIWGKPFNDNQNQNQS